MKECHPGVSTAKMVERFNSELAKLNEKAHADEFDSENQFVGLHCAVCGDELFISKFECGVIEKMCSYRDASMKANDGYINTVLSNSWNFNMDGGIMRIKYWYDPDAAAEVYKIHAFKDKVILEISDGKPHSVIVTPNYYIHCEGKKRT